MSYTRTYNERKQYQQTQIINTSVTHNFVVADLVGTRSGSARPGWRELVRQGKDASTPFTSDRIKYSELAIPEAFMTSKIRGTLPSSATPMGWTGLTAGLPATVSHLLPDQATAEAEALSKFYRKVNAQLSNWSGASALAEFGDVLRQFGHPFKSIIDLTNRRLNMLQLAARGLKGSTVFRKIKWDEIVASTWLEYAFGLAPLMSDTAKAAEALARWNNEEWLTREGYHLLRDKVVARGSSVKTTNSTANGFFGSTWLKQNTAIRTTTEHRVQYVAGLSHNLLADFGSNERLIQLLGFRPQDWIPAAWEVVPWSWLLDYVTNVGNILQAGATSLADVTWCNKTVSKETTLEHQTAGDLYATQQYIAGFNREIQQYSQTVGGFKLVRKTVDRTVGVQPGIPPLVFEVPGNWGQYANMVAVLFSRRPQSSALWLT